MTLAAVEGQGRAVDGLRAALRSGSVHHAYLFGGPDGVGKELTALGFVQALFCPQKPNEGCGECAICQRVQRGNHPDLLRVMPEAEQIDRGLAGRSDFSGTPSREIKVEQIRALQDRLALRALEAPSKVALISTAHEMNLQAQNALLKTLEEPSSGTILILVSSAPDKLLPTIRSRCSKVHFGPLSLELLTRLLGEQRKVDATTAALLAVMAGGSLARGMEIDPKGLEARREVIEKFEAIKSSDARGALRFAEHFGGSRDAAEDALRILAMWMRDLATAIAGGGGIVNRDLMELIDQVAPRYTFEELLRRERLVIQAQNAIASRNASPRLQLERLLLGIGNPLLARETPMEEWIRRYEQ